MTKCILYRDERNGWSGFEASGHAGWAEAGQDIVCAAVSVLTITCVNALESVCGIRPRVTGGEDGRLACSLPADMSETQYHDAQILLGGLHQGLRDLAAEYPGHFTLQLVKRRKSS